MIEKNPAEQLKIKIEGLKEKMKSMLAQLFDEKEKINERIDAYILQLEALAKNGLVFDKEGTIEGLKEGATIQDKETFIAHLLKIIEPILVLSVTQPKIWEKVERERMASTAGRTRLSEVLYVDFEDEKRANIHLATAKELIKEKGMGNFKEEIEKGLIRLAEIIKSNEKVKEIWATSWIVAKNPLLLRKLGFTVKGEIPKEEGDEEKPIGEAFITREDFLARYGS